MTNTIPVRGFRTTQRRPSAPVPVWLRPVAESSLAAILAVLLAIAGFLLHFSLSAAEPLELLLVLAVALRFGFVPASVTSISAMLCLDVLFTEPLFKFTVADPSNWIALTTFETIALCVSRLSSKARLHAAQAKEQQARAETLYELSRAVLYLHPQRSTAEQLSSLIRDIVGIQEVVFWTSLEERTSGSREAFSASTQAAYDAYLTGTKIDDPVHRCSSRILSVGVTSVGGMRLSGWSVDPLMADAIASLAALAFERARAIRQESRAEITRDSEQLRTAVLDGLAHGFKTPLTAITAASSGLLALGKLDETQTELISIIDDRASMLSQLTTELLQTAALDTKQVRLHRRTVSVAELTRRMLAEQEQELRRRIHVNVPPVWAMDSVGASCFELALQQLIDNAAKYSSASTMIRIALHQSEWETVIAVENEPNSVYPIRPDERLKVFERFYRGIQGSHGPAGTGLGLSVVKKIAEAHGGRAWVECDDLSVRFLLSVARPNEGKHG